MVAVDGKVYVQLPLTPGWPGHRPAATTARPTRPQLMSTDGGFSSLLPAPPALEKGDQRARRRGQQARSSPSTPAPSPATRSKNVIPTAEGDFDATYTITDDGELREAGLTGAFYPKAAAMTYTVDLRRLRHREGDHRPVTA